MRWQIRWKQRSQVRIYPACFERGQRFHDVNDMANTLGAGKIHVPQNTIPVLNSIVHTYNKELEELRDYFYTSSHCKVRFLEEKVKVLGRQLSPAVQMPSVYALQ